MSGTWRWLELEEASSTQDVALAAARDGEPGGLAVLARRQTAGRGSRGRQWDGQAGNLFLSCLLRPDRPFASGFYALLAGVALYDGLRPYATGLMLKWPNDLLLDGAKLGGILIEAAPDHGWFVIGIGANLAWAPDIAGRRTARLPPPPPDPATIARCLTQHVDRLTTETEIASAWLERAHPKGSLLDITTPAGRVTGRFAGLDAAGGLLLEGLPGAIASGEVSLDTPSMPPVREN